ncbi:hypothetical protein CAL29_27660 [Bordetella genomosp. 10]|uniref:Uncharacterized protein n=1 Tax=Bordetella genomosp. 10 TaxID=1416804 RepID=A0A261S4E9_9BORD|nr:hypothetical protein [Bordetella genomosp. 10]OZI31660.1 hypothetical protein CAL29_27660 [Bordetella genomosp. 10]
MIPVALPGGNFYPMLVASLICLATLLTWIAVLCTTPTARLRVREHPRKSLAAMGLLALVGAIFPAGQAQRWLAAREAAEDQARRTLVLDHGAELDGIPMPANTRLLLKTPGQLASFELASFPAEVDLDGARIRQLRRYVRGDGAAATVIGASATIAQDQDIDGWRCSHGHFVEFRMSTADGRLHFSSCHLAAGNQLDKQAIPAGTWASLRSGAGAASDPRLAEGWLLRTEGSEPILVQDLPLFKAELRLDPQHRVRSFEGALAQPFTLGAMTYPPGTRVATAAPSLPGAMPGDLVFSPSRGRSAKREGGQDVAAGNSVLQAPDGKVRAVLANRAAGVLDYASIGLTP